MNSEPIPSEGTPALPIASATLQAVLQLSDGGMDSIAVPVPLPELIIRVRNMDGDRYFRRARTADSVVRYTEELPSADGAASATDAERRCCGRCGVVRPVLYIAKFSPSEPVSPGTSAYCESCYSKATP